MSTENNYKLTKNPDSEDDTEAIEKAERQVGADGTDEYFREMTTPERERDPADDEDF
jgi:hypothetical protein